MSKRHFLAMLPAIALLFILPAVAYAQGSGFPPHVFVGKASLDGQAAPEGTNITAIIGDQQKGSAAVMNGEYAMAVKAGSENQVRFIVGGVPAMETGDWTMGGASMIDLTAGEGIPQETGSIGIAGEKGEPGPRGAAGPKGEPGPQGANGADGDTGPKGNTGAPGADGADGNPGPQGDPGAQGEPGEAGETGPPGPEGAAGGQTLGILALILSLVALAGSGGIWYSTRSRSNAPA